MGMANHPRRTITSAVAAPLYPHNRLSDLFMSFYDSYGNALGGTDWEEQVGLRVGLRSTVSRLGRPLIGGRGVVHSQRALYFVASHRQH
jgi:hypothetical protein